MVEEFRRDFMSGRGEGHGCSPDQKLLVFLHKCHGCRSDHQYLLTKASLETAVINAFRNEVIANAKYTANEK